MRWKQQQLQLKPHHSKQIKEEGYHFDKIRNVKKCKLLQSRILCRAQTQFENAFMNVLGALQHSVNSNF